MTSTRFVARPLAGQDEDAWGRLARDFGCVFDALGWTGIFGDSLRRLGIYGAGGELRGGFCLWEERRLGIRVLRNPPYTPQIGPFFEPRATNPAARTEEQRAVVEAMAAYLSTYGAAVVSLGMACGISDALPFFWRGWRVVPHVTYRIDLNQTDVAMLAAMSPERRKNIRKSQADGVEVEENSETSELRALVAQTYSRQARPWPQSATDAVLRGFPPGKTSYCLIARAGGHPAAGVYVVHDSRTAYYLMGGYADGAHHGAGALAMWSAILKAKELGLDVFDFEGSVIPPIERYFRGFGGVLTPVFGVHKAWLPIEMALKLVPRFRNRF